MGQEGKVLFKREAKRVDQSSHSTACNLFATNLDGKTTGDKSIYQLSHPAELAFTHSHLVPMDSSIMEILERLEDDKIYSVRIVGLGGARKTTLAKEVVKKVRELNVFNRVVFANVSLRRDVKKILDQIAEGLGLRWVTEDLGQEQNKYFSDNKGKNGF